MPDRDYYLKDDAKFADTRANIAPTSKQMLKLANYPNAAASADAIVAVERKIAELHWPREKSRDRDLTYNPKIAAETQGLRAGLPVGCRARRVRRPGQDFFIVAQLDAVRGPREALPRTRRSRPGAPI